MSPCLNACLAYGHLFAIRTCQACHQTKSGRYALCTAPTGNRMIGMPESAQYEHLLCERRAEVIGQYERLFYE